MLCANFCSIGASGGARDSGTILCDSGFQFLQESCGDSVGGDSVGARDVPRVPFQLLRSNVGRQFVEDVGSDRRKPHA